MNAHKCIFVIIFVLCCLFWGVSYAECEDPGSEPIGQDDIDGWLGEPGDPTYNTRDCCCYNNEAEFDYLEVDYIDEDWCCLLYDEDCETTYWIQYYTVTPTATGGKWNVDNDSDGDWDTNGKVPLVASWSSCSCNGGPQQSCNDFRELWWYSSFVCESCE